MRHAQIDSFGQPCAKFSRKIWTRNVKIPLPRNIHANELKCLQKTAKRKKTREVKNLTLLWLKYYFIMGVLLIYRQFRALIIKKNSIRFWNVVIYWFVSLRSLKTLCKAALCDTNRFHVRTQEIISLVVHAQTFDHCIILTEPPTKARLSSAG